MEGNEFGNNKKVIRGFEKYIFSGVVCFLYFGVIYIDCFDV